MAIYMIEAPDGKVKIGFTRSDPASRGLSGFGWNEPALPISAVASAA